LVSGFRGHYQLAPAIMTREYMRAFPKIKFMHNIWSRLPLWRQNPVLGPLCMCHKARG
jgi:hypothetical protein